MNFADIKHFIKLELEGFEKPEIIGWVTVLLLIFTNAYIFNDNPIAVISAVCGITSTILAGKGKISCYLVGALGTGFYVYLALKNAIWGNALLYLCYFLPMDVVGVINWSKHLNQKHIIYKTKLSKKEVILLPLATILITICSIFLMYKFHNSHPIIDSITTILSIVGVYLTVKRCIEQWFIWFVVNLLSVIMWVKIVMTGEKAYATVMMWGVYVLLAVYFYHKWKKEG